MRELTLDEMEVVEGGWWYDIATQLAIGFLVNYVWDYCFGEPQGTPPGGTYIDQYRSLSCAAGTNPVILVATAEEFSGYCA